MLEQTDDVVTPSEVHAVNEDTTWINALKYHLSNPLPVLQELSTHPLPEDEKQIYTNEVVVSLDKSLHIALTTKLQSSSPQWLHERQKRITVSRAYELFTYCKNTSPNWEYKIASLLDNTFCGNAATEHGST